MNHEERRLPVWQMVRGAVEALGGSTTNAEVRNWILSEYPGTNASTIACQITGLTVNHSSRVYYCGDRHPRLADHPTLDPFYRPEKGRIEMYNATKHGQWEIYEADDGRFPVRQTDDIQGGSQDDDSERGHAFAAEHHLRDYLAQHLDEVEKGLQLFIDDNDVNGVEYVTPIGRIDILAVDQNEDFVVIELKVAKGPDSVAGQVLRYKNWIKKHLAAGRKVRGIIIAQRITDKIRYAICNDPEITVMEYEIRLVVRPVTDL